MIQRQNRHDGWRTRSVIAVACTTSLVLGLAACGSDEDDAGGLSTQAASTDAPTTAAPAATDAPAQGDVPICALATEMAGQDGFPTNDQLTKYQELAPPEIADAVNLAAPAFIAAEGDTVKFYIAFANDDVEQSLAAINAWETDNCGIDHSDEPGAPLAGGATREREDGATVVDVVATDYAFQVGSDAMAPGRTSLVLTNNGQEAHYMQLFKLADGATMEQVMSSENGGDGLIDGSWDSGVAEPGGADEEALTLDLEPGTYGIACFVSGADGTPHAFMGMTSEFTVA